MTGLTRARPRAERPPRPSLHSIARLGVGQRTAACPAMALKYGRPAAAERAQAEARSLSLVDRTPGEAHD